MCSIKIDKDNPCAYNYTLKYDNVYHILKGNILFNKDLKYCIQKILIDRFGGEIESFNYEAKKFDEEMWLEMKKNIAQLYLIFTPLDIDFSSNQWINELTYRMNAEVDTFDVIGLIRRYDLSKECEYLTVLSSDEKYKRSLIGVSTPDISVELIDATGKVINFERALKNYVQSQKKYFDQVFFQHATHLIMADEKGLNTDSFSEICKRSKFNYTDNQIELLNQSKIIRVWALPDKKYNNKEYVEKWNKSHPHDTKEVEYKKINSIVIGAAVDTKTKTAFNFITDLGQDISVLFDYDTEYSMSNIILKPNKYSDLHYLKKELSLF